MRVKQGESKGGELDWPRKQTVFRVVASGIARGIIVVRQGIVTAGDTAIHNRAVTIEAPASKTSNQSCNREEIATRINQSFDWVLGGAKEDCQKEMIPCKGSTCTESRGTGLLTLIRSRPLATNGSWFGVGWSLRD